MRNNSSIVFYNMFTLLIQRAFSLPKCSVIYKITSEVILYNGIYM
ncbi:hypothetical protein GLYMA_13G096975v4 [Glycine max]|nr:hypothetical protein GLYMA_13G096975v4 [Glycine max]KAH1100638.1 hypothetical protein GYH30_035674 [Glycine max]